MAERTQPSLPLTAIDTVPNESLHPAPEQMPSWVQAILEQQAATNHLLESFINQHSPPLALLDQAPQCHFSLHAHADLGHLASPVFSMTQHEPTVAPTLVKESRSLKLEEIVIFNPTNGEDIEVFCC